MSDDEHRFNTAKIDMSKHRSIEEHRRKKPKKSHEHHAPHWAARIIVILILCVLVTLGWLSRYSLTPSNILDWVQDRVVGMGVGDGYPYETAGLSVLPKNFLSVDKNAVILSDTSLTVLNSTAKELVSRQHSFNSPVIKADSSHMLLYNLGGKGCRIETLNKTVKNFNADKKILSGALAANGRYALLTESAGYCGELTAYTDDGKVKSRYWFSDYYPTAVALNPDGTKVAVTGVSAKDGALVSAVYIIDLNTDKTSAPLAVFSENMLFSISWDSSSTIVAVGDRAAEIIDAGSMAKHSYDYGGMLLTAYATDSGRTALGLSAYENSADAKIVVIDKAGQPTVTAKFGSTVESVSVYGQTAAALAGGTAYFYSLSSSSVNKINAGSDARAIALRDESSAYILGVSEIRLLSNR